MAHTKSAKTHTPCNKNRDFLQKTGILTKIHTTCTRIHPQFSKHLRPTRPKIPYKNNREFFQTITGNYQRISGNNNIVCIQNIFIFLPRTKVSSLSMNCLKRKEGPTLIQLAQLNALWQNWYSIHK